MTDTYWPDTVARQAAVLSEQGQTIDTLRAENEELQVENARHRDNSVWAADRIKALESKNEQLRSDWQLAVKIAESHATENERLRELLSHLYTWDQMDAPGSDGPYWRSVIEEALGRDNCHDVDQRE